MLKLALDGGHWMGEAGRRCPKELDPNETREWWLNARVISKVQDKLSAYAGVEILRVDDPTGKTEVPLKERVRLANEWGADFYLSGHHNAAKEYIFNGGGIVAYCYGKGSKTSFEMRDKLYAALIRHTGLKGNRANPKTTANYQVLRETSMPAVLLEMGFMNSRLDCPIVLTEEFADGCADAIVEVLVERYGLVRKQVDTCILTVSGVPQDEADKLVKEMQGRGYVVSVEGRVEAPAEPEVTYPRTVKLEGMPAILAKNIVPFNPSAPLSNWGNTISGGFSASGQPCSILVQDGKAKCKYACHYWYDRPESVLYRLTDGTVGIARVQSTDELPKNLRWAVGGLGLLDNYNPNAEGFCKLTRDGRTENFSDVLRDTDHTVLGYKDGLFYLIYCKSMTAAQVNAFAKKVGLEMAVMLDGGHVAAIHGDADYAKINTKQKQYYAIQGE